MMVIYLLYIPTWDAKAMKLVCWSVTKKRLEHFLALVIMLQEWFAKMVSDAKCITLATVECAYILLHSVCNSFKLIS